MAFPYLRDLVRWITGWDLPLPIPMFGLFVALAVLIAAVALRSETRRLWSAGGLGTGVVGRPSITSREHLDDFVATFAALMMLAGIAGSRLFSLAEALDQVVADPVGMIVSTGGFNVIGGLLVATGVGIILVRRAGLRVRPFLDAAAPAMMLGYAIGRIGCQISGDGDWGIAADMALKPSWLPTWFWAQRYEGNILGVVIPEPGVLPTPVWETVGGMALFGVLWALRKHPFRYGWLFAAYMVVASLERLAIEPWRVNERYGPWQLSQAQYLSIALLGVGLVGLALTSRIRPGSEPSDAEADLSRTTPPGPASAR
jgi:phosphatidylglycerol:prolipoprotein diacylglycerol transferase